MVYFNQMGIPPASGSALDIHVFADTYNVLSVAGEGAHFIIYYYNQAHNIAI